MMPNWKNESSAEEMGAPLTQKKIFKKKVIQEKRTIQCKNKGNIY